MSTQVNQEEKPASNLESTTNSTGLSGTTNDNISNVAAKLLEQVTISNDNQQQGEANGDVGSGNNGNVIAGGDEQEKEAQPSRAEFSLMNKVIRSKLLESASDVEIIRKDPNNPLHSIKRFEELNLDEALLRGIYDMGFMRPSKIQETALPMLMGSPPRNLIAQSQSGTGKTAAFVLASLSRVNTNEPFPQVIILSPTYELALQTAKVATTMARFKPEIKFKLVVRGEVFGSTKFTEHVLIGTPGKMADCVCKYRSFDPKKVKVYVLDEADVMIDTQGHRQQTIRIKRALSEKCQLLFFSATYDEEIHKFAQQVVPDANQINLKPEEQSLDNITQYYIICRTEEDKYKALANIFGTISIGQTIIFCQTKKSAHWLANKLTADGHMVGVISGDLTVEERASAISQFRQAMQRVLISTNLMARGIDIEQVTLVVNYDLPKDIATGSIDKETYLHRIGRTGRFGKSGLAINMITNVAEKRMVDTLVQHFNKPIEELDAADIDALQEIDREQV